MAAEVATAYVSLVPSAKGFGAKVEREIGGSLARVGDQQGTKFSKAFSDKAAQGFQKFGRKASTFVTAPIVAGFAFAVKAASDLSESVNKTDVVFGKSAKAIHSFAQTSAKDLGISKRGAEEAAGTFGNLFVAMKIGQPEAAKMSTSIVKLAADLASFNNVSPEDALEALRAGLVGETEPLRKFGVNLNDAALREEALRLGLVKTTKDVLPPAAKAQAAYSLIMQQTAVAQGDFARTSDGLANQQRILKAELEDTAASVGSKLLPAALKLVNVANDAVTAFVNLPDATQNVILGFLGVAAAAGPVSLIIGKTITAAKTLATAYEFLTIQAGALALASTGVGLALVGIGAGAIWIQQARQQFREMAQAANDDMGKAVNQLALFHEGEKDVALNAYMAAAGVKSMVKSVTGLNDQEFGKELTAQSRAAREELDQLSTTSGVAKERIVQLADSLGINLATATKDQREQLAGAITEIGRAVTPTDRLKVAEESLGNAAATTAEQFDAFKEALDAALGVQLTADEATLRYHDRIAALEAAIAANGTQTGFATEKQRNLSGALIDVVSSASDEVEALVRSGRISADAATQKQALIDRLKVLEGQFPALKPKIEEYIGEINKIPLERPTAVRIDGVGKAAIDIDYLKSKLGTLPAGAFSYINFVPKSGGGRALGGPVDPGRMYEVTEGGIPELLRQGNRTFLLPGSQGTVIPSSDWDGDSAGGAGSDGPLVVQLVVDGQVLAETTSLNMRRRQMARS